MYLVKRGSGSDRVVDDLQVDDVVERAHAREGAVLVAAAVRERHRLDEVVLRVLHVDAELGVVAEVGVHAERARRRAAAVAHLDQFLVHHLPWSNMSLATIDILSTFLFHSSSYTDPPNEFEQELNRFPEFTES